MRMKVSDLKRLSSTSDEWRTKSGFAMVIFPSGIIGARTPDGRYTELEEVTTDPIKAKRFFIQWANNNPFDQ